VNCSAYNNSGGGISVSGGCAVSNCTAYSNTGDGITALDGSTVTSCTVNNNEARGIGAANGCQITRCTTRNNALDGISVNFSSTVTGNTCNGDGTAAGNQGGIRVLGQANRIEGNNVTYADRGLLVDSGGNVIIRNTVKGCTLNWSIVAGNAYGAIVATPAGAAVSGNTAAAALGTTDPDANFTY
jgi:parallel beta-helix repeat protein